jgi:hypothetical protein
MGEYILKDIEKKEKGGKTMDCFIINNITENDVRRNKLRILVKNKPYFPIPDDGNSQTYDIKVKVGSTIYDRQYRYIRNKSGRLNLRVELYREILQIEPGDILVVVVLEENILYQIINLSKLI